jgi:hypothetical protein
MAKETMKLGEDFSATVQKGDTPLAGATPPPPLPPHIEVKPRHRAIGYGVIAAIIGSLIWWFTGPGHKAPVPATMQERPGLTETLGHRLGGVITLKQIRAGAVIGEWGPFPNNIPNSAETALRDCFNNDTGTACSLIVKLWKFHGLGTSSQAINETDTGCITELTTQYTGDVRATGSQTTNGTNVYRTVGTNTIDSGGPVSIQEFCLMNQAATGGGTIWTRILTGTITLQTSDSLTTTYDLTIE